MKKIFSICIIAFTLFSCSNDDNSATETSTVLKKVVFYKDTPNERHWNFSNNLLQNITLANGSVAEEFIYDAQNRVISDIKYSNGSSQTDVITYNADSTISSINGLPYTYNAATKTYAYSYGSNFTISCEVNADMLAVNFTRTGVNPGVFHMTYLNGNMISFEKLTNNSTETLKNFHFSTTLMDNPISGAVIAVARVKSLTDPNFFVDSQTSKKVPAGFDKGISDPYYYNYGAIPEKKLYQVGIEVLDSNNNFVNFYSFADYHFQ